MTERFTTQAFAQTSQNNWIAPMTWQYLPQPWAQGWRNPYGKCHQCPQYQQPYHAFPPQHVQPTQPQYPNPKLSLPFPQRQNQLHA